MKRTLMLLTTALVLACMTAIAAAGTTIIEDWNEAKPPAAPEIKAVTVSPTDTALLILDIEERTCNEERRPRCLDTVPRIAALMERARKSNMVVVYSQISKPTPILPAVAPQPGELVVSSSVDKFYGTVIGAYLIEHNITNLIITGTAAHGAVLHTATAAARRDFNVIVPVDCLSASTLYTEQAAVWCLVDGPGTRRKTTLTTSDLITIK